MKRPHTYAVFFSVLSVVISLSSTALAYVALTLNLRENLDLTLRNGTRRAINLADIKPYPNLPGFPANKEYHVMTLPVTWDLIVVNNGRSPVVVTSMDTRLSIKNLRLHGVYHSFRFWPTRPKFIKEDTGGKLKLPFSLLPGRYLLIGIVNRVPISSEAASLLAKRSPHKLMAVSEIDNYLAQSDTDLFGNDYTDYTTTGFNDSVADFNTPHSPGISEPILSVKVETSRKNRFYVSDKWYNIAFSSQMADRALATLNLGLGIWPHPLEYLSALIYLYPYSLLLFIPIGVGLFYGSRTAWRGVKRRVSHIVRKQNRFLPEQNRVTRKADWAVWERFEK